MRRSFTSLKAIQSRFNSSGEALQSLSGTRRFFLPLLSDDPLPLPLPPLPLLTLRDLVGVAGFFFWRPPEPSPPEPLVDDDDDNDDTAAAAKKLLPPLPPLGVGVVAVRMLPYCSIRCRRIAATRANGSPPSTTSSRSVKNLTSPTAFT